MPETSNIPLHEAAHAFAFWMQGGRIKTIVAARSGFSDGLPHGWGGACSGEFPGQNLVLNEDTKTIAEKMLMVSFAAGLADQNPGSAIGDMQQVITSLGWAGHKYRTAGDDALGLVEKYGLNIPVEDRIEFFKKHSETFCEIFKDENAQAAIKALADALNEAPGHTVTGLKAALIFESIYADKLPEGILPAAYHSQIGDLVVTPEKALDDCAFHLSFIRKKLDDLDIDDRIEIARAAVLKAFFEVSALL